MERGKVKLNNSERFLKDFSISKEKLMKAVSVAAEKLYPKLDFYKEAFPKNSHDKDNWLKYYAGENNSWICGMHTGVFVIMYELTGDEKFLSVAREHMKTYKKRLDENIGMHDHDVGFVFSPSCVAMHKVTGDEKAREYALEAAKNLYENSYSKKGGFILRDASLQHEDYACRTMVDSMLNIPLLYWAGKETANENYIAAANSQTKFTSEYLVRNDGSSYHHYQFEVGTHKPLYGLTFQGNRDESTWSRGHSWCVLGFPISYSYSGDEKWLLSQRDTVYYMLNNLPEDNIPYWDYDFVNGDEPRDTSAGVISACGMLEGIKYLPQESEETKIYKNAANMMIDAVIDRYTGDTHPDYDGLLWGVTGAKPFNMSIEGCASYGDYFYLEALIRLIKPDWKRYW